MACPVQVSEPGRTDGSFPCHCDLMEAGSCHTDTEKLESLTVGVRWALPIVLWPREAAVA